MLFGHCLEGKSFLNCHMPKQLLLSGKNSRRKTHLKSGSPVPKAFICSMFNWLFDLNLSLFFAYEHLSTRCLQDLSRLGSSPSFSTPSLTFLRLCHTLYNLAC